MTPFRAFSSAVAASAAAMIPMAQPNTPPAAIGALVFLAVFLGLVSISLDK